VHATLQNDRLELKGTANSGDDRYLVYGSLIPPRIDVIAPASSISFNEFLKRLARIKMSPVDQQESSDATRGAENGMKNSDIDN
jgi:hypothetical protein